VENGPTLVMINGGFIRGDRLKGPGADITARDVRMELPFPGTMADDESGYKYLLIFLHLHLELLNKNDCDLIPSSVWVKIKNNCSAHDPRHGVNQ
jgi:hypothetical protein